MGSISPEFFPQEKMFANLDLINFFVWCWWLQGQLLWWPLLHWQKYSDKYFYNTRVAGNDKFLSSEFFGSTCTIYYMQCCHFPYYAVSKVESDDAHSELSDATPLSSIEVPPPKSSSPIQPVVPERALFGDLGEDDMHPLVADPEVVRLETQLDTWCLDLKRNVLVCWITYCIAVNTGGNQGWWLLADLKFGGLVRDYHTHICWLEILADFKLGSCKCRPPNCQISRYAVGRHAVFSGRRGGTMMRFHWVSQHSDSVYIHSVTGTGIS